MLTGFEIETAPLTKQEEGVLMPLLVKGLITKIGKDNAITNKEIRTRLKERGVVISDARIRKIINFIRVNQLIKNLISTSKGYYIATTKEEVAEYIKSLEQREAAIRQLRKSFKTEDNAQLQLSY